MINVALSPAPRAGDDLSQYILRSCVMTSAIAHCVALNSAGTIGVWIYTCHCPTAALCEDVVSSGYFIRRRRRQRMIAAIARRRHHKLHRATRQHDSGSRCSPGLQQRRPVRCSSDSDSVRKVVINRRETMPPFQPFFTCQHRILPGHFLGQKVWRQQHWRHDGVPVVRFQDRQTSILCRAEIIVSSSRAPQ